jgi:hypothetical protein
VQSASLYRTHRSDLAAYPELIAQGAGFIKRNLLQRNFSLKEKLHLLRYKGYDTLNADYRKLILDAGIANDFKEEWLPEPDSGAAIQFADRLWQKAFHKFSNLMHKNN